MRYSDTMFRTLLAHQKFKTIVPKSVRWTAPAEPFHLTRMKRLGCCCFSLLWTLRKKRSNSAPHCFLIFSLQSSQPNLLVDENGPPLMIQIEPESSSSSMYNELEYCLKMIRKLEHEKYIQSNFGEKFFTWFCLQERRVVRVYVAMLRDDPVYRKRLPPVRIRFCAMLWHCGDQ